MHYMSSKCSFISFLIILKYIIKTYYLKIIWVVDFPTLQEFLGMLVGSSKMRANFKCFIQTVSKVKLQNYFLMAKKKKNHI